MHESRVQRTVGLSLLSRQTGSIAPDHPPKQLHAWVSNSLPIDFKCSKKGKRSLFFFDSMNDFSIDRTRLNHICFRYI